MKKKIDQNLTLISSIDQSLAERLQPQHQQEIQNLQTFIDEFLGNFISADTKKAYLEDLTLFFSFLRKGGIQIHHPKEITAHQFQVYRDVMIEKKLASATINRRLVCIRSFLKWSISVKLIDTNPLDALKLPKVRTESPTIAFDDEEVTRMIGRPDVKTQSGLTHRLVMVLLFHLGLRRSELVHLKLSDFFEDRGHFVLKVLGKGGKERLIPLSEVVINEVKNYLLELTQHQIQLASDDYLIQTKPKKLNPLPADGSTIFRIINRYARELGINKRVSPHSCRATVISHLLDTQKTPIRDVAIFAGHSIISTTERYDKRRKNLDTSAAYQVEFPKKVS